MAWGNDFPLVDLAQRLVDTRLRAERIRLVQRLQGIEVRADLQGLSTKELKDLRKALQQPTLLAADRVDPALVLRSKPEGIWRRRYLSVQSKPGSVF